MSHDTNTFLVAPAQVMRSLSAEMHQISELMIGLEAALFDWVAAGAPEDKRPSAFHDIDAMVQATIELRDFLDRLDRCLTDTPEINLAPALAPVRLGRVRERLSGKSADPEPNDGGAQDIEFF